MAVLIDLDGTMLTGEQAHWRFLKAFRAGNDTFDIAKQFGVHEAVVYNALHRGIRFPQQATTTPTEAKA